VIARRDAVALAVAAGLSLVGPVALARSASPIELVAAQREAGLWTAVLQPVALAVVVGVAAHFVRASTGRGATFARLSASAAIAVVFLGGWTLPGGGMLGSAASLAAKVGIADLALRRLGGAIGGSRSPLLAARVLVQAALVNAGVFTLALASALAIRTPMGQGILLEPAAHGVWVGWLGAMYFFGASATGAAAVRMRLLASRRQVDDAPEASRSADGGNGLRVAPVPRQSRRGSVRRTVAAAGVTAGVAVGLVAAAIRFGDTATARHVDGDALVGALAAAPYVPAVVGATLLAAIVALGAHDRRSDDRR
jgi:hypothetical protein